jgi:uncharacterized protein YceK
MFPEIFAAFLLLALCVVIHASGLSALLRHSREHPPAPDAKTCKVIWIIVRTGWCLTALHLVQIALWAAHYRLQGCLPDFETALYFSGVSYSTLGYGDVVLPQRWRMLGPAEGLTGILMCGLSTALFFAILHQILEARVAHRNRNSG